MEIYEKINNSNKLNMMNNKKRRGRKVKLTNQHLDIDLTQDFKRSSNGGNNNNKYAEC